MAELMKAMLEFDATVENKTLRNIVHKSIVFDNVFKYGTFEGKQQIRFIRYEMSSNFVGEHDEFEVIRSEYEIEVESHGEARLLFEELLSFVNYIDKNRHLKLSTNDFKAAMCFDVYDFINNGKKKVLREAFYKDWDKDSISGVYNEKAFNEKRPFFVYNTTNSITDLSLLHNMFFNTPAAPPEYSDGLYVPHDVARSAFLTEYEMSGVLKRTKLDDFTELEELSFCSENTRIQVLKRYFSKYCYAPESGKKGFIPVSCLSNSVIVEIVQPEGSDKKVKYIGMVQPHISASAPYISASAPLNVYEINSFELSLKEVIEEGGPFLTPQDLALDEPNSDEEGTYNCHYKKRLFEREDAVDFVLTSDYGEQPKIIQESALSFDTPCGVYAIIKDNQSL